MSTKKTKQPQIKKESELTPEEVKLGDKILEFFQLSRDILSSDFPEYVNETPEDWKFHTVAKEIAQEMNINWDEMSYEESSALMLNLLLECWADIEEGKDLKPIVRVIFPKEK